MKPSHEPSEQPSANGKLKRKRYEKRLRELQVELCYLQDWVRKTGKRVVILFEGRDTAGKGGLIRVMTERVSPRTFRVVALSAPAEGEKKKMFLQRYIERFPAAGEIVIFDRSWYNRAGVDRVMQFAREEEVESFLDNIPRFEQWLVPNRKILVQLWVEGGQQGKARPFPAGGGGAGREGELRPREGGSCS